MGGSVLRAAVHFIRVLYAWGNIAWLGGRMGSQTGRWAKNALARQSFHNLIKPVDHSAYRRRQTFVLVRDEPLVVI